MRRKTVKAFAAALSASMILSLTPVSVFAEGLAAPTEVSLGIAGSVAGTQVLRFDFSENDKDWLKAVTGVSVDGTEYKKDSWINMMPSANTWYAEEGYDYDTYQSTYYLRVTNDKADTTEFLVTAEGYEDVIVSVVKNADGSYAAQMKDLHPSGDNTDPDETPAETTKKTITIDQVSLGSKSGRWILSFPEVTDYVSSIESLSVNGEEWAAQDYEVNLGGKYYQNTDDNEIRFVGTKWTVGGHDILKSGDVITITSSVYEDLTLKFNYDGTYAAITEDDGEGDLYQLNVKLEGTFGSAIKGQKEYDAVSSATGVVSSSDNSDVKVYAAISEKGSELSSDAWQELGVNSEIQIDPDKTFVSIVPDTEKGTSEDRVSGLEGLYLTIGNELTLIGAPQDPGDYLVTVTITDTQGRTAVSNAIPLKIHSGEETLAEMLTVENLTQTADGKYMWKNMEPWTITVFGSNVEGESETIVVPAGLKAWYGSSESGLYGNLGYAIPWADVQADRIPQTLIIPAGCDLTMVNMEFQSSVKIIVEDGGKLTLRDSVVQGIIDVKGGGSFSMNYNGFGEDAGFQTGSSVDGQIILEDGAVIENAAVVSHTNYIANGAVNDRTNADAVVAVKGNVTVKGQVFIAGDEAGSNPNVGQTGLLVQNGTLTLEEGAVLAVYGGDGKVVLTGDGGTAIELVNGTITGSGKLIAVGGAGQFGNGGAAVRGSGTIETDDIFLQGGSTRESNMLNGASGAPGAANPDGVAVKGSSRSVKNGILNDLISDDAQAALYWNTGVDAVPDIFVYTTEPVPAEDADDDTNKDADDQDDDSKKDEDDQDDDSKKDADDQDDDSHTSIIVVVHRAVKSVVRYAVRIFRGLFRF
ncbi:MAG: hypothetical protein Q4B03_09690 [Lachnospiraceae bacterium]|nr:hypothetical protein [Lachnospiraceae bacterium]